MDDDDIKSPRSSMSARSSETGEPLDFSFCELLDVADLEGERPRAGRTRAMVSPTRIVCVLLLCQLRVNTTPLDVHTAGVCALWADSE